MYLISIDVFIRLFYIIFTIIILLFIYEYKIENNIIILLWEKLFCGKMVGKFTMIEKIIFLKSLK